MPCRVCRWHPLEEAQPGTARVARLEGQQHRGHRLHFYYAGGNGRYGNPHITEIGLATLRLDGFCSMYAGEREGWLITRREQIEQPRVMINARVSPGGCVVAEILDRSNNVVPGFSRHDCVAFKGDSVRHILTWRTQTLPASPDQADRKLRFYLRNADLYAYLP